MKPVSVMMTWLLGVTACLTLAVGYCRAGKIEKSDPPPGVAAEERVRLNKVDNYYSHIEDERPVRNKQHNKFEYHAYCYTLGKALELDAKSLKYYANKALAPGHLYGNNRQEYRGELFHMKGKLRRLHPIAAPESVKDQTGIETLYEAWIFVEPYPRSRQLVPIVAFFAEVDEELLEKVPAGEKFWTINTNRDVAFDAYYFKLVSYTGSRDLLERGRKATKRAPLMLGKRLEAEPPVGETVGDQFTKSFFAAAAAVLGGVLMTAAGLRWWFRRGDRTARQEIADRQAEQNPFEDEGAAAG